MEEPGKKKKKKAAARVSPVGDFAVSAFVYLNGNERKRSLLVQLFT